MVIGRDGLRQRFGESLASACAGTGGALALVGEAGIGKTALLDSFAADAGRSNVRLLRACGFQSEMALPYASLADLLLPLSDLLLDLPVPQAAALSSALRIGPPVDTDRFAVCAATLSLLVAAARREPVLLVVDDAHWVDDASAEALNFVVHRLSTVRVLTVLAYRQAPGLTGPPPRVPVVHLPGLTAHEADHLLRAHGREFDDQALTWLMDQTAGNPLALLELPKLLTDDELSRRAHRGTAAPITASIQEVYEHGIAGLPLATRRAMLLASLLTPDDSSTAWSALLASGLTAADLLPAADAGLLTVGESVGFRHPLVRSAVQQISTPSQTCAAHAAIAAVLEHSTDPYAPINRAWHLADATIGADDAVADLLQQQADAIRARSGYHAASLAFERSAQLSTSAADRSSRFLSAAIAAFEAGNLKRSQALAERVEGAVQRTTRFVEFRGRLKIWTGSPHEGARELDAEASRISREQPEDAIRLLLHATYGAALYGQLDFARDLADRTVLAATHLGPGPAALATGAMLIVKSLRGDGAVSRDQLDHVMAVLDVPEPSTQLMEPISALASAYLFADHIDIALRLYNKLITVSRHSGALSLMPFLIGGRAVCELRNGEWDAAYRDAMESVRLAELTERRTDIANSMTTLARIECGRGMAAGREHATETLKTSTAVGGLIMQAQARSALGLLELGLGHLSEATEQLHACGDLAKRASALNTGHTLWVAELVEALTRSGSSGGEAVAVTHFAVDRATLIGTPITKALAARCEGMIAADSDIDDHFMNSLHWHNQGSSRPFELAHTQLCYGERLRRAKRRRDARDQLFAARRIFAALDAKPWTERATDELRATGLDIASSHLDALAHLTPRERQVATAVAAGSSNRDVAASLFMSQKTVEYHLSRVFRKLDVSSRQELSRWLAEQTT